MVFPGAQVVRVVLEEEVTAANDGLEALTIEGLPKSYGKRVESSVWCRQARTERSVAPSRG
jgi:hypothetical protein